MTSNTTTDRAGRVEGVVQAVIMAGIGVMAGAASFTHMHDWTMANAPAGAGDWFGWANAVASELTPTVAVLDIRRRRRAGKRVTYPVVVLVCSVALSLSAQFACARPSVSGWLLAAVPAVAFLALTKMVLTGGGSRRADLASGELVSPAADRPDAQGSAGQRQAGPDDVVGAQLPPQQRAHQDGETEQRGAAVEQGEGLPVLGLGRPSPDPASPPHGPGVAGSGKVTAGVPRGAVRPASVNGVAVMPR